MIFGKRKNVQLLTENIQSLKSACIEILHTAMEKPPRSIDISIYYSTSENTIMITFEEPKEISEYYRNGGETPKNLEEYEQWNLELHRVCNKVKEYYLITDVSICKSFGPVSDYFLFRRIRY